MIWLAKSVKFENDIYLDSSSVMHNKTKLSEILKISTDEKIVGTWINDKPLYEKTIVATKVSGTDLNIDIGVSAIDNIFIYGGSLITTQGTVYGLDRYEAGGTFTRAEITSNKTKFHYVSSTGNYTNGIVIAILRYTKTTD